MYMYIFTKTVKYSSQFDHISFEKFTQSFEIDVIDDTLNVSSVRLGFFPPMQPLMIMDYLGLEQLTAGFGFVTMLKGPAAIIGPPFAGLHLRKPRVFGPHRYSGSGVDRIPLACEDGRFGKT